MRCMHISTFMEHAIHGSSSVAAPRDAAKSVVGKNNVNQFGHDDSSTAQRFLNASFPHVDQGKEFDPRMAEDEQWKTTDFSLESNLVETALDNDCETEARGICCSSMHTAHGKHGSFV